MKSKHHFLLSLGILSSAIFISLSAQAQETTTLDAIQVTANRNEIAVAETLASVTVITRSDIEQSQVPDVYTLLSQQVGIDITRSGGPGSLSSIFLRGSNSNHSLILIDGVRVNSATQGSFDISQLSLNAIDRIEIVRGPRAAFWGSDAIGGVIQFFTRKPSDFVQLRAGSYGQAELDAGIGFGDSEHNFGVSLGYARATGFSATNPQVSFGFDPDDDGYNNGHLQIKGQTRLGEQRLTGFATFTTAEIEFDQGITDQDNTQAGLQLSGALQENWQHQLGISYNRERLDTPAFTSVFATRRIGLDWINTFSLNGQNTLNAGVNWSEENGFSNDGFLGFDKDRRNLGVFIAWRGNFERHDLELSARHDDNDQFGGKTTAQAAWGITLNDKAQLRASWGQGFRAPNFNELYYPGFFGLFAGNPNLKPESSESIELGLNIRVNTQQSFSVSAYHSDIDNLIAFAGPIDFAAVNINRARLKGLEGEYQFNYETFSLTANASWQDARDARFDTKLLRRADRKLNINADFKINEQWHWGLDFQASSARPDFGSLEAKGYGRLDARIGYRFGNTWHIEARLENLGDKTYELIPGYNNPGRSGLISLRWNGQ